MNWIQWRNREHKDIHATVTRDGFTVPLLYVPDTATLEECQRCGKTYNFTEMKFSKDGELLCPNCRK